MDVLTDILNSAGLVTHLLAKQALFRPWAVRFPCEQSMGFHVVTQGEGYVRSDLLAQPIKLKRGDFLLLSRGFRHDIATGVDVPARDHTEIDWGRAAQPDGVGAPLLTLVCGVYQFRTEPIHPFFQQMPSQLLVRAQDIAPHDPLHAALALLSAELAYAAPGEQMVTKSLIDILFNYIIRNWMNQSPAQSLPWPKALRDKRMELALSAMHSEVQRDWDLGTLARISGSSRTSFAQRFKDTVGDTPMRYLARVRIQKAMDLLRASSLSVEQVGQSVGFNDPYVFSKAFKRLQGTSPRDFRAAVHLREPQYRA